MIDRVVVPVLEGMRAEGTPYAGFLYVGLMLTTAGPKVIEFNVRFGDPEAQVVLPMLESRLADLLMAAASGTLGGQAVPGSGRNRTCAWWWRRRAIPIRRAPAKPIRRARRRDGRARRDGLSRRHRRARRRAS